MQRRMSCPRDDIPLHPDLLKDESDAHLATQSGGRLVGRRTTATIVRGYEAEAVGGGWRRSCQTRPISGIRRRRPQEERRHVAHPMHDNVPRSMVSEGRGRLGGDRSIRRSTAQDRDIGATRQLVLLEDV